MAVVAAFELHDLIATGKAACHANRAHRSLGARGGEAHLFDRRHYVNDELRDANLSLSRRAVANALIELLTQHVYHLLIAVTQDKRSPSAHVIYVAIVVGIDKKGAFAAFEEQRVPAHAAESAHR